MATIILRDDNIKVKVPLGMTLRQVSAKTGASMEFGCRVGDCSTCIAQIDEGMDLLNPPTEKEHIALDMLETKSDNYRLMCQCVVNENEGEIVISYKNI